MLIYECDMCKKQFMSQDCAHEISVVRQRDEDLPFDDNMEKLMVCDECSRKIGDFVKNHKKRMEGFKITVDQRFGENQ